MENEHQDNIIEKENELMKFICKERNNLFSTKNSFIPFDSKKEPDSLLWNKDRIELRWNELKEQWDQWKDQWNQFVDINVNEYLGCSSSSEPTVEELENHVIEFEGTLKRFNQVFVSDIKPWTQHSISPPSNQNQFNSLVRRFNLSIQMYKEIVDSFELIRNSFLSSSGVSFELLDKSDNDQQLNENAIFKMKSGIQVLEESLERKRKEEFKLSKTFVYSGQIFE